MPLNRGISVIGSAMSAPIHGRERSLEEILYDVVRKALADADLPVEKVDGIIVASNDQFDGRAISIMAASGSVGGVGRDILSTPSAAEHAFVMGALRIASGQYETQVVVSWSTMEAHSIAEAERLGADPYFHRRLPLDEVSSFALQASALQGKVPSAERAVRALAGQKIDAAGHGRWPLTNDMILPPVTGAVAIVLASEQFARRSAPQSARIRGMGWATEPGFLGDRDLAAAPALSSAAKQAYEEAGIAAPLMALEVAEISDPTPYQKLLALEGLGLLPRDAWANVSASDEYRIAGDVLVNPSGGFRAANAVFCAGLMRIAEAANQIRRRAGKHQVMGARTALGHAASGFAMQYQTVVVFGQ